MLTFIEAISVAGDRAGQNDDAFGHTPGRAWVIDGATDLHQTPLSGEASDAAWLAHWVSGRLHAAGAETLAEALRWVSASARLEFLALAEGMPSERWKWPIASIVYLEATGLGLSGIDLGDCRVLAMDADGVVQSVGAAQDTAETDAARAAQAATAGQDEKPLYQRDQALTALRLGRAKLNQPGARWSFGLDPECVAHARTWTLEVKRPAHILLMTDGFAALADRYGAYDAAGLVHAALDKGLHELGRELREIERADAAGARHPRFKPSDDATALLLRLT